MKRNEQHFKGCLLGGAVGDAFGAPMKFMKYDKIISQYGENGITSLESYGKKNQVKITDDTQLTLFTAEGLLRDIVCLNSNKDNKENTNNILFRAYLRWLYTQGLKTPNWSKENYDGWLIKQNKLHGYSDPDITCVISLGKGIMGTIEKPINSSKCCGAVIRVAPIGLIEDETKVFEVGKMAGVITHGHPTAFFASGALAMLIYYIIEGNEIKEASQKVLEYLRQYKDSEECQTSIKLAIQLAEEGMPSTEKMHTFGDGFLANDVLGMGLYAALTYQNDFNKALCLAINQNGNSNSAASITGNILGAYLGENAIPIELIEQLDSKEEIKSMAEDLLLRYEDTEEWLEKYPGW
ncbi:MAG: ADP-ribosylglycohydrolase family protein [Cellulosilyticaceae bacterium]